MSTSSKIEGFAAPAKSTETYTMPNGQEFTAPASSVSEVELGNILEAGLPEGVPLKEAWEYHKAHMTLVSPLNRRKFTIIAVSYTHLTLPTNREV